MEKDYTKAEATLLKIISLIQTTLKEPNPNYDVSTTPFACLDYLVIVDTGTPLGKTVLGAFPDFIDAKCFLDLCNLNGTSKDSLQFTLVDRIKNRMINFSYDEAHDLKGEEIVEYFNGKEKDEKK